MDSFYTTSIKCVLTAAALVALAIFPSCEEVGPNIDLGGPGREEGLVDTTYVASQVEAPQTKNVLLEDFTGVRCKNCPLGADQAASMVATYPGRVVVIGQHSQFLATPYPGDPDLRTDEAQDIENMLAPVLGKPSAAIDRRIFPGESTILQPSISKWANLVSQAIQTTTAPVNLTIETTWDATNRNLRVKVTVHYTSAETVDNRLSVFLLEEHVVAAQLQPDDEIDSNYVQKHVMRTMLTRFNGELLSGGDKTPGRVFVKEFELKDVSPNFNADELAIVAVVARATGSFEVLQVVQKEVL